MIKKFNQKWLPKLNIIVIALIIFLLFSGSSSAFTKDRNKKFSEVPFGIHALNTAEYHADLGENEFPHVDIGIVWEILNDQNTSDSDVDSRWETLLVQLQNPIPQVSAPALPEPTGIPIKAPNPTQVVIVSPTNSNTPSTVVETSAFTPAVDG
jgi:hypothetical protein